MLLRNAGFVAAGKVREINCQCLGSTWGNRQAQAGQKKACPFQNEGHNRKYDPCQR